MSASSLAVEVLHHVALTSTDLERSRAFYRDVLGLVEIERPNFSFPGAWFQIGANQHLHLIVHDRATFRANDEIDTRDVHFAVRVPDYTEAVGHLRKLGYSEASEPGPGPKMKLQPHAKAGFPQIYILDPDHHVIEINAAKLFETSH